MSVLDLRVCPICQAQSSLARQKIKLEGESHIAYECLECGSVLLWLGDDLWLQADRWAYQKIGRANMEYLLQRSMTADELRTLAAREPPGDEGSRPATSSQTALPWHWQPPPPVFEPPPAEAEEPQPGETRAYPQTGAPLSASQEPAAYGAPEQRGAPVQSTAPDTSWAAENRGSWEPQGYPEPAYGPYHGWAEPQPARRARSRGSPFLTASVVLTLLCLVCSSVVMIASTTFTGRAPLGVQSTEPPPAQPVPSQVLVATEPAAPVESPVPVPTATPQPLPTLASALQSKGVTDYVAASTGSHYVVGEVLNTTGSSLWFVQVLASYYDGQGQMIGGGSTFTELSIVEPGKSAPFKLATIDPPPGLATYELRFDYQTTSQKPLTLEIIDSSSFSDESGWHHIVGDVRNDYGFAVKFPEIVATYYDAANQVLRVETVMSQFNTIQPGELSPFEIVLADPPPELHHYALQTEALQQ